MEPCACSQTGLADLGKEGCIIEAGGKTKRRKEEEEVLREGFVGTPHKRVYNNNNNPLVEGVPKHIHRTPPCGPHIFKGLKYSGASD